MHVADPRSLLAKYGLYAKKSWGQNFLIAPGIHEQLVRAAVRSEDDWVVEIGAGLGTLTARLAQAAPRGFVIAIERDRDMALVLRNELGDLPNLEIAEANALTFDFREVASRAGKRIAVVGNLPYQIASPLLFHVLAARGAIERVVVMLQKEMADRLLARPGSREYGALGVMVSTYAQARLVVRAPAGAFHPAPKVDSAVLELDPYPSGEPRSRILDEDLYSQVVHAAFSQRRKTLRNALRARFPEQAVDSALRLAGIDGARRGETLSVEEFASIANALKTPGHA
ncbi:MAG: ribosomal RNA small subunit methyltransferase A [Deltaproteobacteria bacterium]|nr:ribosomal RNA small subunit methyltransferase A [Deltaproteobacteria bacterium]